MMTQEEVDRIISMQADNLEIFRKLKSKGFDELAIARWMGISENAVRLMAEGES